MENIVNTESYGAGVRVLADGAWGFYATDQLTPESIAAAAEEAVAIAKANAKLQESPVQLAPQKGLGEVSWKTPIKKNAFDVPLSDKIGLLMAANAAATKNGANFVNSNLFLVNEQKYFASTDGSYIDQDVHRIWPVFGVTAIDPKTGKFQIRQSFSAPCGRGYEYLDGAPEGKLGGPCTRYTSSYDLVEDAGNAAKQVREKLAAKSVEAGQYDLVLDPTHLYLTIHESVGHATELDRVLGYEANFAGTSFATLDKWKSGDFKYGSPHVHIVADKVQPGTLGAVGYDDEGVPCGKWDLIKEGILVNYQKTRDQAHIVGQKYSDGCCYSDSWNDVQFQRMPNVSLQPGPDPKLTTAEMIKGVERGIFIVGAGIVFHRPATLQFPVRRPAFLRDQERRDRGHVARRGLPVEHAGILEFVRGGVRPGRLRGERFLLRRQGPAGTDQRRVARFLNGAFQQGQRAQHRAQNLTRLRSVLPTSAFPLPPFLLCLCSANPTPRPSSRK